MACSTTHQREFTDSPLSYCTLLSVKKTENKSACTKGHCTFLCSLKPRLKAVVDNMFTKNVMVGIEVTMFGFPNWNGDILGCDGILSSNGIRDYPGIHKWNPIPLYY